MKALRGMSFVDVIVGIALILIVFLALLGLLRASLLISSSAKAKSGATAVASTQVEYLRSLSYDSVGTLGGIPAGLIPQHATTTFNGISYGVRTLIEYVDDPKDGSGSSDSNSIMTDYKRVRVTTTYMFRGTLREVAIVTNIAPPSIETTVNGGTLRINVVNATGAAVSGATVQIQNSSTTPTINFTTFTDIAGTVSLPGAPVSTGYQVTVTKNGYSTATTYARDATNQNPTPGYLTVANNQTTTSTFAVDLLATLTVRTLDPVRTATSTDTFTTATGLASQVSTQVLGGNITLAGAPGSYSLSGTAQATSTIPTYLSQWTSATATRTVPAGTTAKIYVTDGSGGLLPDSVLPGNSTGFASFPISLTGVSTTTYPMLALRADLTTSSVLSTPLIQDWTIFYQRGPVPRGNVNFSVTGAKKKGTTGAGAPIYKTVISTSTDATGVRIIPLEWDVYTPVLIGVPVIPTSSTPYPYTISPGSSFDATIMMP